MQLGSYDDRGTFFIVRLMELPHYWVFVGIDREHGEADYQFARSRICPSIP